MTYIFLLSYILYKRIWVLASLQLGHAIDSQVFS